MHLNILIQKFKFGAFCNKLFNYNSDFYLLSGLFMRKFYLNYNDCLKLILDIIIKLSPFIII